MTKRKYVQGERITSLDELFRMDRVMVHTRVYDKGWVRSWQLGMAKLYIDRGSAYKVKLIVRGQAE